MTKQEIFKFIMDKKIPVSFIRKDNNETYYLYWYFDTYFITTGYHSNLEPFPNVNINGYKTNLITFMKMKNSDTKKRVSQKIKLTTEQCLSNFIYWFEINKSSFTDIKYYND